MKRQSLVLLAVAFVAAGAAGCFSDPVSSLRNGPATLSLDHQAVYLKTGDSVAVVAEVKDDQGNVFPASDAAWTVDDQSIAVVREDTAAVPAEYFTRGFIRGVTPTGGWTTVTVTARGLTSTIRVVVLPANVTASLVSLTGTATTDTAIIPASPGPPPTPPDTIVYSAPDTLVLSGTSFLNFDTSAVAVYTTGPAGTSEGFVFAKSPTQISVVFSAAAAGKVVVKNLLAVTGNANVGTIAVDSLIADSMSLSRVRFAGTISQLGDTMTINAGGGESFTSATTVSFGTAGAILLSQTASQLNVLSPVAYTGQVNVNKVTFGTAVVNTIATNAATPYSMNAAVFPQGNVTMSPNNARLGDTVIVTAPSGLSFVTSGSASARSNVILGNTASPTSDTAWMLSRTASTLKVFAKRGGGGNLTVTNLMLASGSVIPKLTTPAGVTIDSVASDFPISTTQATATMLTIPANDTAVIYSSIPPAGTVYWRFTTTAAHDVDGNLSWFGSGCPYGAYGYCADTPANSTAQTEDLDLLVCNVADACDDYGNDLGANAAATISQPEVMSITALPAGQYAVGILGFNVDYAIVYRLTIILK
jgi:hypothetical protein